MDYRLMFSADWLACVHLGGKEHTVTIERVEQGEMPAQKGKKATKKPVLHFKDRPLPYAPGRTVCKVIANAYGTDTTNWVGKSIVLYPTTTDAFGETVDCIRVKIPASGAAK